MEVACVLIPDSALSAPVEATELTERVARKLGEDRGGDLCRGEGDGVLAAARAARRPPSRP